VLPCEGRVHRSPALAANKIRREAYFAQNYEDYNIRCDFFGENGKYAPLPQIFKALLKNFFI